MQQGICVDVGLSAILKENRTYFLREHGKNNYYVSNFNNPKSYFGSFRKEYFRLIAEPKRNLRRFVARVAKNYTWYTLGDEYIITEKDHNGYFHVYMKNRPHRGGPIGSYLNNFFEIIEPFSEAEKDLPLSINQKLNPKEERQKEPITLGQMDLFDFIDG